MKTAAQKPSGNDWILALILTAIVVAGRLLPHPANITPIAAAGILGFALFDRGWLALVVQAAGLLISNLFLPMEHSATMLFIHLGMFLPAFLGIPLRKALGGSFVMPGILAGVGSALIFYLFSNLGVFLWSGMYPLNVAGLVSCYAMALPFLVRSLIGDVFFVVSFLFLARTILSYQARAQDARLESAQGSLPH